MVPFFFKAWFLLHATQSLGHWREKGRGEGENYFFYECKSEDLKERIIKIPMDATQTGIHQCNLVMISSKQCSWMDNLEIFQTWILEQFNDKLLITVFQERYKRLAGDRTQYLNLHQQGCSTQTFKTKQQSINNTCTRQFWWERSKRN